MAKETPTCCDEKMELKSVTQTGTEQSRKYGIRVRYAYHFQCKHCGKTKLTEVKN